MINIIIGLMNSGKTLYMTHKLFQHYLNKKNVVTNYGVSFPHYKVNRDWLLKLALEEGTVLNNIAMGLDEAYIWMDARGSMSNKVGSYFFLQSSKSDTPIYLTAQHIGQLDLRLRENAHKITKCSRVIRKKDSFIPINDEYRILSEELQNNLYIKAEEFKRVNINFSSRVIPSKTFYIKAKPIFMLYDTHERVLKSDKSK